MERPPPDERFKVYDVGIDINAGTNFASLFRVNRQVYAESYDAMLRKYSFTLARLPHQNDRRYDELVRRIENEGGLGKPVPGVICGFKLFDDSCLASFPHYDLIIDATQKKKAGAKQALYMLIGFSANHNFAFAIGAAVSLELDMRKLSYKLELSAHKQYTAGSAMALLDPYVKQLMSFPFVSVTCASQPFVAKTAQEHIRHDRWESIEEFLYWSRQTYHTALAHWDNLEADKALNAVGDLIALQGFVLGSRQFFKVTGAARSRLHKSVMFCVVGASMVKSGLALRSAMGSTSHEKSDMLALAKRCIDNVLGAHNKAPLNVSRTLQSLAYLHRAVICGFLGEALERKRALRMAQSLGESDEWFKRCYREILEGKLRVPFPEGIITQGGTPGKKK